MKIKEICPICEEERETQLEFIRWLRIKLGTEIGNHHTCDKCCKVLLELGLARFSNITLEQELQKERWINFRNSKL